MHGLSTHFLRLLLRIGSRLVDLVGLGDLCAWYGSCSHGPCINSSSSIAQDNALKYLHYVDSGVKFPVRNGLEDLPERIEVATISEIATGTCIAPPGVLRDHNDLPPTSPTGPSPLSFSLLSVHEGSLADQIAPDQSRWADWTDGLNMLRRDGGHVASQETAGFVQALTEIGLKIKLLGTFRLSCVLSADGLNGIVIDLSGEKVEIPSGLTAGPPPANTDFFFSDL